MANPVFLPYLGQDFDTPATEWSPVYWSPAELIFNVAEEGGAVANATLTATLSNVVLVSTAQNITKATFSVTLATLTASSTAQNRNTVSFTPTLANLTSVSTARVPSFASLNKTLEVITTSETSTVIDQIALAGVLADATLIAIAEVPGVVSSLVVVGGGIMRRQPKKKHEKPKFVEVDSSNLKSVKYDEEFHELTIKFNDKAEYHYSHVPKSVHDKLMDSDSKGKYFHDQVRDNYFYVRRK